MTSPKKSWTLNAEIYNFGLVSTWLAQEALLKLALYPQADTLRYIYIYIYVSYTYISENMYVRMLMTVLSCDCLDATGTDCLDAKTDTESYAYLQ